MDGTASLKSSEYTIYVPHQKDGTYILVHGYTGAVDVVDSEVAEYLLANKASATVPRDIPNLPPEILQSLRNRGYLTTRTPTEEEEYLCQLGEVLHRRECSSGSSFYLCPTYKCQLRCGYCFELWLYKKGEDYMERQMSEPIADAAFDAMGRIQPDPRKIRTITLFGGEPLLAENVGIVSYMLEQCRRQNYASVSAITNGVDLESYLHLLGRDSGRIGFLQITLDGPAEIHNGRRYGPNNEGTYEAITANVSRALETGAHVSIRTNVDQTNLPHIDALAKLYHDKGWSQKPNFTAYCQAVFVTDTAHQLVSLHNTNGEDVLPARAPRKARLGVSRVQLAQTLRRKQEEYPYIKFQRETSGVARTFENLIERGPLRTFHPTFCGTSNDMYVFDAWGDIYVCTEAVGDPSARVGTYYPELSFTRSKLDDFHSRTIMSNPICRKCPWALFCGGGCMEHAKQAKGEYHTSFCAEYQALFVKLLPEEYDRWFHKKERSKQLDVDADSENAREETVTRSAWTET
jgi:uncharacterized protein